MHHGLEAIWLMLGAANRYFSAQEPWVLRKSEAAADQERFRTVLYTTLEAVRIAALLVQPVMPDSAAKLLDLLGQPNDQRDLRRHRHAARARHGAPDAGRGVPPLPGGRMSYGLASLPGSQRIGQAEEDHEQHHQEGRGAPDPDR